MSPVFVRTLGRREVPPRRPSGPTRRRWFLHWAATFLVLCTLLGLRTEALGQSSTNESCSLLTGTVESVDGPGRIVVRYDLVPPADSLLSPSAWWHTARAEVLAFALQSLGRVRVSTTRLEHADPRAETWVSDARRAMIDASDSIWTSCVEEERYPIPEGIMADFVRLCRDEAGSVGLVRASSFAGSGAVESTVVSPAANGTVVVVWTGELLSDSDVDGGSERISVSASGHLRVFDLLETLRDASGIGGARSVPDATCYSVTARVAAADE